MSSNTSKLTVSDHPSLKSEQSGVAKKTYLSRSRSCFSGPENSMLFVLQNYYIEKSKIVDFYDVFNECWRVDHY